MGMSRLSDLNMSRTWGEFAGWTESQHCTGPVLQSEARARIAGLARAVRGRVNRTKKMAAVGENMVG